MASTCEKDLIDIITALTVPLVALIAAYIAWQQWRINERRFKHELFYRNFKVYEAIIEFFKSIVTGGKIAEEDRYRFYSETKVSKFLMGEDIESFIEEINDKAIDIQTIEDELEGLPVGEERTRLVRERRKKKNWILNQFAEVDKKFAKYMSIAEKPRLIDRIKQFINKTKKP